MIYLHTDKRYRPDQWYRRFEVLFKARGLRYKKVDLRKRDPLSLKPEPGDALMGRFGHNVADRTRIKPVFGELAARFEGRTFPAARTYALYDDKQKQLELFEAQGYPTPASAHVESKEAAQRFMENAGLDFPVVTKRVYGAGSAEVALAHAPGELKLPGIVQEYCRGNAGDLRINVIGRRIMGFFRNNRPGDFRASGSGSVVHGQDLDPEAVALAYRISQEQDFECMAYDFVRDNRGNWVVLEMSYCFVDQAVRDCPFYVETPGGEKRDKAGVYPQDFILEDFFQKHPEVKARALEPSRPWFAFW